MSYFINSGIVTLSLDTSIDITTASTKQILYQKPNGVKGAWTATADGTSLTYNLSNTDIDVPGVWKFQTYVEIGGKKGYGGVVETVFMQTLN